VAVVDGSTCITPTVTSILVGSDPRNFKHCAAIATMLFTSERTHGESGGAGWGMVILGMGIFELVRELVHEISR
jgi:hypothetical protein